MNYLANLITGLSLVFGFFSIILSLESHFTFASWAIILSVILDGLDGQVARKNPVPSDFGKELDSLVDVVSFGVAPAILGYIFVYRSFYVMDTLALLIYLICSVARLAKYNILPKEKMADYFYGLPTTVSGGTLASFVLIYRKKSTDLLPEFVPAIFLIIVLVLAFLMVSRIRYLNLDGLKRVLGANTKIAVLVVLAAVVVGGLLRKSGITLFTIFLIYLIFSPFVVKRVNNSR